MCIMLDVIFFCGHHTFAAYGSVQREGPQGTVKITGDIYCNACFSRETKWFAGSIGKLYLQLMDPLREHLEQ
jgi:hypothetical protein